uniref:Glycoside hydrolase family 38 central domain-containing protein n=1 Tax=mine drainage metagenome TaxID=410659 RepID=E6Q0A2_9ZZZZ
MFSLVLVGPGARAQSAEETASFQARPEATRTVLQELSSLSELPDGAWKMHSGDLAHGEALHVEESAWQPIALGAKAPRDAVWFRQTITVPARLHGYDLTGARIWFQFHAGANGPMPQILYFNGRRVALGDDLEPVVLFDDAHPGESVTVAVKLLHTVDDKTIRGATMRIDFPETRPNPVDLGKEIQVAALLLPSLAPGDTAKQTMLAAAVSAVDLKALNMGNQAAFDASVLDAQKKLEALKPLLQTATWHLTGNSHIDAAWLWPWTETVDVVKRTFGTALQLMYEYPRYTYTQSAAAYNEWIAQKYPEMNAEIKRRIDEGRWEVVGGMWVEPDLNMPDGESLVRQLLVGKRWYKQAYGVDVRIGWNPDSFGYNWQLPQIYKKSGVDYFVTQKMTWNDTNQLPFKLFWWESPDGSKVLAYFPHDYGNNNLDPVRLARDLASARERSTGLTEMMDLYGIGDHGGGPTRAVLDEGFHWSPDTAPPANSTATVTPNIQFGTALPFFTSVEKQVAPESKVWDYTSIAKGYTAPPEVPGEVSIPTWKSELYLEYHRGVFTTQANHKRNMRASEEEVLNAEKWASMAWLDGRPYPGAELTEDWKKVLFNQFHDLAAGSGIGVIYKDAQEDYDVVRWSTNEISAGASQTLDERIDTRNAGGSGIPVVVMNPLGWERSGEVTVTAQLPPGQPIEDYALAGNGAEHAAAHVVSRDAKTGVTTLRIAAQHVPALGYKVLWLGATKAANDPDAGRTMSDQASQYVLENDRLRVTISKTTGCITSLYDKQAKFETLASGACGNELQAFKDTPKDYDAWNIDPGTLDQAPTALTMVDAVAAAGNQAVRVTRSWQNSKFAQTIRLAPGSDEVDVDNQIDWHETHVLLKAAFPLAVHSDFATYEIPYGSIQRTTLRNNSWEKAQFEVPAMRWADLTGSGAASSGTHGMSLINQTKYGYDCAGNVLRLSLLRSPTWPDPEADRGHHHFRYALYPHGDGWQQALTVHHGWEYNYPLTAAVTTAHPGALPAAHSFVSVSPENVVLTAVKKAEDSNGLIFRVYEWAGKATTVQFHIPAGATAATVTDMQEIPEGDALPIHNDTVEVPIKPYEILTVRADYSTAVSGVTAKP